MILEVTYLKEVGGIYIKMEGVYKLSYSDYKTLSDVLRVIRHPIENYCDVIEVFPECIYLRLKVKKEFFQGLLNINGLIELEPVFEK